MNIKKFVQQSQQNKQTNKQTNKDCFIQAIKHKYFDHGLRPLLAEDYFNVGIMMAVAMLQNGQVPVFVQEDILQQIVSEGVCLDPCVAKIQQGL